MAATYRLTIAAEPAGYGFVCLSRRPMARTATPSAGFAL